jgi:linoleoyl-CoA desaturase
MKAKHLDIASDRLLFNEIYKEIRQAITFDPKKSNTYFGFKAVFYTLLCTGSYLGLFFIEQPVLYILDFMFFGFVNVLMCFNFAHDLSHDAIFASKRWNNSFFEFIYTLVGAHPEAWKKRHINSHHLAPNVENFDTDLAITGLIRVLPGSNHKWYHRYQHLYASIAYATYSFYWVFIKDFVVLNQYAPDQAKFKRRYYFKFTIVKLFYISYILLLPILFGQQMLLYVLVGFLSMHLFQSVYTLFTFFITHHVQGSEYPRSNLEGEIETSWFMNQIQSSNDFHPHSHVANFIFGGVNCHIAHHLYPHINHYYYPQVNRILYAALRQNAIQPKITSFFGGIQSHLRHLKDMGEEKHKDL